MDISIFYLLVLALCGWVCWYTGYQTGRKRQRALDWRLWREQ